MRKSSYKFDVRLNETFYIQEDVTTVITALAHAFTESAVRRVGENDYFSVALSGGSAPPHLFRRMLQAPFIERIPWQKLLLFWGDERCVAPDHAESNYGMACRELLDHVPIPKEHVIRMSGENDPEQEAIRYAAGMKRLLPKTEDGIPVIDWTLHGVGPDGHTASLFPPVQQRMDQDGSWVIAKDGPDFGTAKMKRITFDYPLIAQAREIAVLVLGAGKADIMASALNVNYAKPPMYPIQRLRYEAQGKLSWWMDAAAASKLVRS